MTNPPPWLNEELPLEDEKASEADSLALFFDRVRKLEARVTLLEKGKEKPEVVPDTPGILPRGKYKGKTHDWVVETDPWYVQWLDGENKAYGLGFNDEQIDDALGDPRPNPVRR